MPRNELRRRIEQRAKLIEMRARASEEGDAERVERIEKSLGELDELLSKLRAGQKAPREPRDASAGR